MENLVLLVMMVQLENQDYEAPMDQLVCQACQDQRVNLVKMDHGVFQELLDHL